jgi:hypothetical protein
MARAVRYTDRTLPTAEERFDAKVSVTAGGCHEWHGYVDAKGYGVFGVGGRKLMKAHRYSYARAHGEVPSGLQLDHVCRNRRCVNPAHLEPVTSRENTIRGNLARGPAGACSKGHTMDAANTYVTSRGRRECRACRAAAQRRFRRANLEKNCG